jgi:CrcB protein
MPIKFLFLVALGGAAGALSRYLIQHYAQSWVSVSFPWPTWLINVSGCLLIGLIMGLSASPNGISPEWKYLLATGFCGGFTTFSAFGWENLQLIQAGKWSLALLYTGLSVILGIAATAIGYKLTL